MQNASLAQSLSNPNLVATVFAPTNDAFAAAQQNLGLSQAQIAGHPEILSQVGAVSLGFDYLALADVMPKFSTIHAVKSMHIPSIIFACSACQQEML